MPSDYTKYQKFLESELKKPIEDFNFKSNNVYKGILEHVSVQQGNQYYSFFLKKYSEKIKDIYFIREIVNLNDSIGRPNESKIFNFTQCSPTNMRYLFHACLILEHIFNKNIKNANIIEIGGGYGGLSLFVHKLSSFFEVTINSYTIFDLKEPSKLQEKYCEKMDINTRCCTIENFSELKENSFLISNYALSEFSPEIRQDYVKKIIEPYVSNGFLVWNFIKFYKFIEKDLNVIDEYPRTGKNNKYIYF